MDNEKWFKCYVRACREDENGNADPKGRITFPERFDENSLAQLQASLGPYMFSCLYLNAPMSSADMVFRPEWIKQYEEEPYNLEIFTLVDPAGDATQQTGDSDYNVVMTTGKHRSSGRIYVLDYWRKRANPKEVVDELFRQEAAWHPIKTGVESVAYQNTFIFWTKEEMAHRNHYFLIEPVKHGRTSKEARIRGLQPLFANGQVLIRTWMTGLSDELKVFPLGAHDDLIDCLAMGLYFWGTVAPNRRREWTNPADDTLLFDRAVEEIQARQRQQVFNNPVFTVLESAPFEYN
jgi:predicted phage terminase large subunit-like protein